VKIHRILDGTRGSHFAIYLTLIFGPDFVNVVGSELFEGSAFVLELLVVDREPTLRHLVLLLPGSHRCDLH
jgi:hypothetical protein